MNEFLKLIVTNFFSDNKQYTNISVFAVKMNFEQYNIESSKTKHTDFEMSLSYLILALNEESGEVAGVLKKTIRDHKGVLDATRRTLMLKECGDVLWYLNQITEKLGSNLEEVAKMNIEKLQGRKKRGTLRGSGDNR